MPSEEQKSAEWWKFCLSEVNDKLNETIQQKIELRKELEEAKARIKELEFQVRLLEENEQRCPSANNLQLPWPRSFRWR